MDVDRTRISDLFFHLNTLNNQETIRTLFITCGLRKKQFYDNDVTLLPYFQLEANH